MKQELPLATWLVSTELRGHFTPGTFCIEEIDHRSSILPVKRNWDRPNDRTRGMFLRVLSGMDDDRTTGTYPNVRCSTNGKLAGHR